MLYILTLPKSCIRGSLMHWVIHFHVHWLHWSPVLEEASCVGPLSCALTAPKSCIGGSLMCGVTHFHVHWLYSSLVLVELSCAEPSILFLNVLVCLGSSHNYSWQILMQKTYRWLKSLNNWNSVTWWIVNFVTYILSLKGLHMSNHDHFSIRYHVYHLWVISKGNICSTTPMVWIWTWFLITSFMSFFIIKLETN